MLLSIKNKHWIIGLLLLVTCKVTYAPISKVPNNSDAIRLDGYYYFADSTRSPTPKVYIHFYYSDGTRLFWQSSDYEVGNLNQTLSRLEGYLTTEVKSKTVYPNHYLWSAYELLEDQIILTSWYATENWKKSAVEESLIILNDTLLVDRSWEPNHFWQFRYFKHKPDSSSSPIK